MITDPQELVRLAVESAEEKKAFNITVLNIGKVSVIADYFIICSSRSPIHARAIAEEIGDRLKQHGMMKQRIEGYQTGRWILLDYGSVVVHIFHEEDRSFYNLEHLWGDAPVIQAPGL
ncbi:ribosome-associated protein [Desulfotomaculum arcticum]|uniref:Ribosomal silencing factor RsfS n=1 Tax=Desulfotruncus arcticus DSM 17038 TaxID=1121424 RepID=A0A1I2UKH1_9FIRM|nr:ribosome silencing factor [Desulfotruncus arcticus]SFG77543.1 ribosome-associated protein [Desulfotomaculum arcticum] [Desulfotruncus arcticus DSM 17038]